MKETEHKPINNVTVTNLDLALRMIGIIFDEKTIDKIIDLVDLLENKGSDVSIQDICDLQNIWQNSSDLHKWLDHNDTN